VSESCPQLDRSASLVLPLTLRLRRIATQVLYVLWPQRQTWTSSPHRRFSGYGRSFRAKVGQTTDSLRAGCHSQVRGWRSTFCGDHRAKPQLAFLSTCHKPNSTSPRASERMASSTIRRRGSIPGSRKPTTANTEPARIYRIRNRVSRASLNNRRGGYSISLLKNSPDLSGALLDAGRSAALVTTDRVVHKARQRIELSLRRSELLAIIDECSRR
jgi:hypothetical protein